MTHYRPKIILSACVSLSKEPGSLRGCCSRFVWVICVCLLIPLNGKRAVERNGKAQTDDTILPPTVARCLHVMYELSSIISDPVSAWADLSPRSVT